MAAESEQYYLAFETHINNANDWMQLNFPDGEHNFTGYEDVAIFSVGHKIGEVESDIVDAISADPVRRISERDYCVHFAKMTKKVGDSVQCYSYTMPYRAAGMTKGKSGVMFNQQGNCRYMPEGYTIVKDSKLNKTDQDIITGRQTTGKHVCDQVDAVRLPTLQSRRWVPEMQYGKLKVLPVCSKRSELSPETLAKVPALERTLDVSDSVIKCISLMAYVGRNAYGMVDANRNFNGIVVTPVIALRENINGLKATLMEIQNG